MKKVWIESAFGDDPIATTSKPTRSTRKPSTALSSTTTTEIKKKPATSGATTKLTPLITKLITNFNNQPAASASKHTITKCPLTEKYEPVKRADLVVHKSKIEQLSSLIDQITSKPNGSILM